MVSEKDELKIEEVGHGLFKVFSKENIYYVIKQDNEFICTCPGYLFNKKCKHIKAVEKRLGVEAKCEGEL